MNTKINGLSLTLDSSQTHVRYRGEWYEIFEDQEGDQYILLKTRALYIELPVPQTSPSLSTGEYIEPENFKGTPGNWQLANDNFARVIDQYNIIIANCDFNIHEIAECTGNATLISQSKELAKALQEAVAYEEEIYEAGKSAADWHNNNSPGVGQGDNQYQSWVPLPDWVAKAREVLQKAIPV